LTLVYPVTKADKKYEWWLERKMKYIVESEKTVEQASADLEAAVTKNNFGVLHVHDLQAALKKKGINFSHECLVFEVCNPQKAETVLGYDMSLNMALPCRISVWHENGKTRIGMLRPTALLAMLSKSDVLAQVAEEVEEVTIRIINEAK
jgi:uncharacterized protein (DUF302 family)